jgi:hypothetical protein
MKGNFMTNACLNRRQFLALSLAGLAALALPSVRALADSAPLSVEERAVSTRLQASLGTAFSIHRLAYHVDQWRAEVNFQGLAIHLKSNDGLVWYTADWQPPTAA